MVGYEILDTFYTIYFPIFIFCLLAPLWTQIRQSNQHKLLSMLHDDTIEAWNWWCKSKIPFQVAGSASRFTKSEICSRCMKLDLTISSNYFIEFAVFPRVLADLRVNNNYGCESSSNNYQFPIDLCTTTICISDARLWYIHSHTYLVGPGQTHE